jgi:hypothetical protein
MHQRRALVVGIALHAALLSALVCGMVLDLTAGHGHHLGPLLIACYVGASLVITTAMFWPAIALRRRPGAPRATR